MKIQILQMIEGARKARGLTVVIDVFRAFSLECYLMAKHPSRLCPVGAEQTARDLKMRYPEAVLIGERHGVNASGATEILTGSLVNAAAIARYIKASDAEEVSLVAMGWEGKEEAPEDLLCARYIKSLLEGTSMDMEKELKELRETPSGAKFFKPETQDVFPEGDYWMCTDVDQFDFVLKVSQLEKDIFEVKRIDI